MDGKGIRDHQAKLHQDSGDKKEPQKFSVMLPAHFHDVTYNHI